MQQLKCAASRVKPIIRRPREVAAKKVSHKSVAALPLNTHGRKLPVKNGSSSGGQAAAARSRVRARAALSKTGNPQAGRIAPPRVPKLARAGGQRMRMRMPRRAQAKAFLLLKSLQCMRLRSQKARGHTNSWATGVPVNVACASLYEYPGVLRCHGGRGI